ncbi:hypothetical protein ACTFIU_004168 [Dictyostelium citrinum]
MVSTSADIGSPKIITNIDIISVRRLIAAGVFCFVALIVAIIVGATGPEVYESVSYNLYQCSDNTHIYTTNCTGFQLYPGGGTWSQTLYPITSLNKFWALQATPYSNNLTSFTSEQVTFLVVIYDEQSNVVKSQNSTQTVVCNTGFGQCNTFTLIDEEDLESIQYSVEISIVSENTTVVGDIDFDVWRNNSSFSSFEIITHLTLLIISAIAIIGFLIAMRSFSLINWAFEQKFLFLLFFGILLANNPFYGIQYATQGAFFPFLNAFFDVIFLSIFALYSLMVLDRIRMESKKVEWDYSTISKIVVVVIFMILGLILFSWINVRDRKDPIIGSATSESGIQALFYLVATVFICILLWILLLVITAFPVAYARQYLFAKYLFTAIPIVVFVLSILIGIIAGTFGPLNPNSLSVMYFNVLNNVFVAIVAYSYWPNANPFHKGVMGSGEEQSLVYQDDEI